MTLGTHLSIVWHVDFEPNDPVGVLGTQTLGSRVQCSTVPGFTQNDGVSYQKYEKSKSTDGENGVAV